MKLKEDRPYFDPENLRKRLAASWSMRGRSSPSRTAGSECGAGLQYAKDQGWLEIHESGTFVRMKQTAMRARIRARSRPRICICEKKQPQHPWRAC